MCIIIYRKADSNFPDDATIERCWNKNDDGAGIMWPGHSEKGFMTLDSLKGAMRAIPNGVPAAIHFRIGTNGANTADNCHPWPVRDGLWLMHNGILSSFSGDRNYSDSRLFGEVIGASSLDPFNAGDQAVISRLIGYGNKVLFMNVYGDVWIANEKAGVWHDGCWYSNEGFREYIPQVYQQSSFLQFDGPVGRTFESISCKDGKVHAVEAGTGTKFCFQPDYFARTIHVHKFVPPLHNTVVQTVEDYRKELAAQALVTSATIRGNRMSFKLANGKRKSLPIEDFIWEVRSGMLELDDKCEIDDSITKRLTRTGSLYDLGTAF